MGAAALPAVPNAGAAPTVPNMGAALPAGAPYVGAEVLPATLKAGAALPPTAAPNVGAALLPATLKAGAALLAAGAPNANVPALLGPAAGAEEEGVAVKLPKGAMKVEDWEANPLGDAEGAEAGAALPAGSPKKTVCAAAAGPPPVCAAGCPNMKALAD